LFSPCEARFGTGSSVGIYVSQTVGVLKCQIGHT
jgi:hypothetical protein